MEVYSYTHGTSNTEQDLVTSLNTFLTTTIGGWELYDNVSDTDSNRDYVWKSPGEDPENYQEIYVRVRAQSDYLYLYGYGSWTSVAVYGDELYNSSYTNIPTGSFGFKYWIYGNKDFFCVTVLNSNGYTYSGYLGLIESTYLPETDPYPLIVKGQAGSYYTWHSNNNIYMHATVASGEQAYVSINWDTLLDRDLGLRDNSLLFLPVIMCNTTASNNEVRGRPYGVYQVSANRAPHISNITTSSGVFLCFRDGSISYTDRTFAYGPVASGIEDFSM